MILPSRTGRNQHSSLASFIDREEFKRVYVVPLDGGDKRDWLNCWTTAGSGVAVLKTTVAQGS